MSPRLGGYFNSSYPRRKVGSVQFFGDLVFFDFVDSFELQGTSSNPVVLKSSENRIKLENTDALRVPFPGWPSRTFRSTLKMTLKAMMLKLKCKDDLNCSRILSFQIFDLDSNVSEKN